MTRLSAILAAMVLWASLGFVTQRASAIGGDKAEPRQVTVATALIIMRRELTASWKKDKRWPRMDMDFATEKNWAVPTDDVIRALGKRLDQNPAIDGYLKWQLMGFQPELKNLSAEKLNELDRWLPDPLDRPKPVIKSTNNNSGVSFFFGRQQSYISDFDPIVANGAVLYKPRISTLTTGVASSSGQSSTPYDQVRRANAQLALATETVAEANRSIILFRDELIKQLNIDAASRLAVMFKDVRARLKAGESTYQKAMRHLVSEARTLSRDPSLTPQIRGVLIKWTYDLAKMKTVVVDSLAVGTRGKIVPESFVMQIDKNAINELLESLQP